MHVAADGHVGQSDRGAVAVPITANAAIAAAR